MRASRLLALFSAASLMLAPALLAREVRAAPLTFIVTMSGAQVVPPRITATTGLAQFVLDTDTNTLDFGIFLFGVSQADVAGAELRQGPLGAEGPLVVKLAGGGWAQTRGRVTLTADEASALLSGALYVEVLSVSSPGRLVRGQILPPAAPANHPMPPIPALASSANPPPVASAASQPAPEQAAPARITPPSTGDAGLR